MYCFFNIIINISSLFYSLNYCNKIIICKYNICRIFSNICTIFSHCNSNILTMHPLQN